MRLRNQSGHGFRGFNRVTGCMMRIAAGEECDMADEVAADLLALWPDWFAPVGTFRETLEAAPIEAAAQQAVNPPRRRGRPRKKQVDPDVAPLEY